MILGVTRYERVSHAMWLMVSWVRGQVVLATAIAQSCSSGKR